MARSYSLPWLPTPARSRALRARSASQGVPSAAGAKHVLLLRMGLIAGCGLAAGAAAWMGEPAATMLADPGLARLLRGMALIKGLITSAALLAVYWRLAAAAPKPLAAAYACSCWVMVGATVLVWQLSMLGLAVVLFDVAALSLLLLAWRDG